MAKLATKQIRHNGRDSLWGRIVRLWRVVWPKNHYEVFVIDGKWLVVFHLVIVALIIGVHWKVMSLQDF